MAKKWTLKKREPAEKVDDGLVPISALIPRETYSALQAEAEQNDRSLAAQIRVALKGSVAGDAKNLRDALAHFVICADDGNWGEAVAVVPELEAAMETAKDATR